MAPEVVKDFATLSDNEKSTIAEYIRDIYKSRKTKRSDEEMRWAEVERQLRMEPEKVARDARTGLTLASTNWMPQLELHLQCQAHEALTADAKRLIFPKDKSWFSAHALVTDKWLKAAQAYSFVAGTDNDIPSKMTQDTADRIVECAINHFNRMYSFRKYLGQVIGQSYIYGTGVARMRRMRVSKFTNDYRGGAEREDGRLIPAFVPRDIKTMYLDDTPSTIMREGFIIAPLQMEVSNLRLSDLKMAVSRMGAEMTGSENERAGWLKQCVLDIPDDPKNPTLEIIDFEGDVVIPLGASGGLCIPNVVGKVAIARGGPKLIRLAKREYNFQSYLEVPYHQIFMTNAYAISPLIMGSPLHKAATHAINRTMQGAALSVQPPVQYDPNDQWTMMHGGLVVEPGAQWPIQGNVKVHMFGQMNDMIATFQGLTQGHGDVTGVDRPRLGAQTKSHQTAYAVDAEVGRGLTRTVDFVDDTMECPITNMLHMQYEMAKNSLNADENVYCDRWKMWIKISSHILPEQVVFETHGSAGPAAEREKAQMKMSAIQMALQLEPYILKVGGQPMNYDEIRREILREGGYIDVDTIVPTPAPKPVAQGPADPLAAAGGQGGSLAAPGVPPIDPERIIAMATQAAPGGGG